MDTLWKILATLGLVALNGYFVAAEFAAVGARQSRLETEAERSLMASLALRVKKQLDLYLSTCQLGITIASLALGAVTEPLVAVMVDPLLHRLGFSAPPEGAHSALAIAIALTISTAMHVVVGEQAPKNWAILYADKALPLLAPPLVVFTYLFYPLIWLLNTVSNRLLKFTGVNVSNDAHGGLPHTEQELRGLLAQAVAQGTIAEGHEKILTGAFELGELKARQVMTPRTDMAYLRIGQPVGEVLRIVQKSAFSRFPLVDGDIDHVIGVVHLKDLFNHLKLVPGKLKFLDERTPEGEAIAIPTGKPGSEVHVIGSGEVDMRKIRRDTMFVPELTPVTKLLRQFQQSHTHMAIVVDEYGATQGVVTLEDVIEEIVGDIEDEFDAEVGRVDFVKDGENFRVTGRLPLHELRDRLQLAELDDAAVDTVGGYVVQQLGRFPRPGDSIPLTDRYVAKVTQVNGKRVAQMLITPKKPDEEKKDGAGEA